MSATFFYPTFTNVFFLIFSTFFNVFFHFHLNVYCIYGAKKTKVKIASQGQIVTFVSMRRSENLTSHCVTHANQVSKQIKLTKYTHHSKGRNINSRSFKNKHTMELFKPKKREHHNMFMEGGGGGGHHHSTDTYSKQPAEFDSARIRHRYLKALNRFIYQKKIHQKA